MDAFFDEEIDTMPWPALQAWQRARLPTFIGRVRERSTFYAGHLAGVRADALASAEAWSHVPFTNKDDLRQGQQAPTSGARLGDLQAVADDDLNQVLSSSGTTGLPVFFGLTRRDREAWANSVGNMWFTAGIRRDSVVALTTGMQMVAGGMPFAEGISLTGAALVWMGGQTPQRMVSTVERLKVDVLIGTASFLTFFAERCEQLLGRSASSLAVRKVIGGGEPGTGQPAIRERIKQAWGAERVSEIMGICDVMAGLWGECPEGQGMHFTGGRNVMVELIDPETGRPVDWEPGIRAEAVYTTFTREATPVVRFRSRDHMQVGGMSCACGRGSPVVRCVGRTDDMLIYKAMNVFPSAIRDIVLQTAPAGFAGPLRIRKSEAGQVRFDDPIPVEIELVAPVEAATLTDITRRIEQAINERLRVRVAVELVPSGTIAVSDYKNALTYVGRNA